MISAKRLGAWLLVVGVAAICVATLTPTSNTGAGAEGICIICHDWGLGDFLTNIILFAPLGFAIALRGGSFLFAFTAGLLLSGTVELLQLTVIPGRDPSFGDIIANSTGAAFGWFLGAHRSWWAQRAEGEATRALGAAAAAAGLLLAGLYLLTPALPRTSYTLLWTPALEDLDLYSGAVLDVRLDTLRLPRPGRIQPSERVRELLHEPTWSITFVAEAPPDQLTALVAVRDARGEDVLLVGIAGHDVVYWRRALAAHLRLDQPHLRARDVLTGVQPGDTVQLHYRSDAASYCAGADGEEQCGRGYTVGDTWGLLLFPQNWGVDTLAAMQLGWLFGVFGIVGLLAFRPKTLAAAVGLTVALLIVGPPVLGFAVTPPAQLLAAVAGLLAGFLVATGFRRE